jgi:hypothetical protein
MGPSQTPKSILSCTWGNIKNAIIGGFAAILFALLILLLSVFTTTNPKAATTSPTPQPTATISAQKVEYYLPYPGILPDSPLYRVKAFRDRVQLAFTLNGTRKAEKELFYADKRINAAVELINGGKSSLGVSTATKAEKYLDQAARRAIAISESGEDVKSLLNIVSTSASKHIEIMESLLTQVSASDQLVLKKSIDNTRSVFEAANQALLEP